jgi:hypothetical protein
VAADLGRRWMLMRDFGGTPLRDMPDEDWMSALRLLAEIQIDSATDIDRWRTLGCPDYSPVKLAEYIDHIIGDSAALQTGLAALSDAELRELEAFAPYVKDLCAQLEAFAVPATLYAQDMRIENMISVNQTYLYHDWSWADTTHPFFGLTYFVNLSELTELRDMPETTNILDFRPLDHPAIDHPLRHNLLRAYLEPWTALPPLFERRSLGEGGAADGGEQNREDDKAFHKGP